MNDEQRIHFMYAAILYPADFSEIRRKWAGNNPAIIIRNRSQIAGV